MLTPRVVFLADGIGDEFRSEMVIGNFNEAEAKDYLLKFVLPDFEPALQCTDADWAMIYEVRSNARCRLPLFRPCALSMLAGLWRQSWPFE